MCRLRFPCIALLCLVCLFAADCSGDDSPSSSGKPKVHELPATYEEGIAFDVAAGKNVHITATGEVNTNPDGPMIDCDLWTDADGIPDCSYVISETQCHGLPFMALIGIYDEDEYFLVGTEFDSTFAEAGRMRLEINDWAFTDNAGAFTVTVIVQ